MPSFLKDFSKFSGDGSVNEDGLTLEEFLEEYDHDKYERPSVTADIMVFKHSGELKDVSGELSLLMIKRRNHPSIGYWALPGGFCEVREDFIDSARRELFEETGLTGIPMEKINTFGEVDRDPRYRIITGAFIALVDDTVNKPVANDDAADARWFNVVFSEESEENITEAGIEILRRIYRITLTSDDADKIVCSARAAVSSNTNTILRETHYEVIESSNIAFDHARFILNGLLHIRQLINHPIFDII